MNKFLRPIACFACSLFVIAGGARFAAAQGFNIGGIKVQTNQDKNNQQSNSDDDDDDQNQGNNNQGNNNSNRQGNQRSGSRSNNNSNNGSNQNGLEQFFNGQGNNNQGQNGSNQSRRSGQQGFPNNQQGQNWQQGNQNGISIGTWNGGKWQGSRKIDSWTKQYGGNQQPFSSQWYNDHPKAWKYDNNKANIWVTASLPGVYSWLNWGNVPQQYQGNYGNVQQFDTSNYGNWYPLGVFSLMSGPGDSGTRIVQLSVDRNGQIAGNYYDMITNSSYNITGNVRRQSQRVEFSLNKNQFVRFRAPIYQLLQPYGTMTVQLPGGEQQWQFVRLEN